MQEQQREAVRPGAPPPAPAPLRMPVQRKFANQLFVPVVLFVLIVGGLAWLVQYVPSWRKKPAARVSAEKQLVFPETRALWDPGDPEYAMEFERGQPGHYDFPFQSAAAMTVELGLSSTSCDCSKVDVAILSDSEWATWQELQKKRCPAERPADAATDSFPWNTMSRSEKAGIGVPANARGLVRVSWTTRKSEGQHLRLAVDLWTQPEGQARERRPVRLETGSVVVGPALFTNPSLGVGSLGPGGSAHREVVVWSATRSRLKFEVLNKNPLIVWKAVPLDADECRLLQQALRGSGKKGDKSRQGADDDSAQAAADSRFAIPEGLHYDTRVRSAFRVTVTVYEQRDGKQLDQGPFQEMLSLRLDDQILTGTPAVFGSVRGEVDIPAVGDQGKINLGSFKSKAGTKRSVLLWTDRSTGLSVVKHPDGVKIKLAENPKDSTPQKKSWELKIEIPAGSQVGPLPDDSAVILRTQSATPRQIRIPLLGTAVQG